MRNFKQGTIFFNRLENSRWVGQAWARRSGFLLHKTQSPSPTYLVNFFKHEKARAQSMKPNPSAKKSGPTHLY
jgi:hypothetical protein